MSFLAKLEVDGESYNVLEFDMHVTQTVDHSGKPKEVAEGGNIRLVVESTRSVDFMKWMISNTQTKDGVVVFYRRDALSKLKELKFTKAYCIDFKEKFLSTQEVPMTMEVLLSCKKLDFSGAVLEKPWAIDV